MTELTELNIDDLSYGTSAEIEDFEHICVQNVVCSSALVIKGPCDKRAVFKGPVFNGPVIKGPVTVLYEYAVRFEVQTTSSRQTKLTLR